MAYKKIQYKKEQKKMTVSQKIQVSCKFCAYLCVSGWVGRVFANGSRDQDSVPGHVIPKN